MKTTFLFLCTLLGAAFAALAGADKLAFERADAVWVAKIDGTDAKKIAEGGSPELSPDGRRLAFNTQQANGQRTAKSRLPISPPGRS